ncbi:RHS repeat domain-containing protein [Roseburia intestinalis]|jgi:RHS repeat-associated protein|uniref:RHS repeat-associated core domain-containing protein n=1 Tax=Roseburia intestinalis TaxID=166486 RepID=A0A3R6B3I4_9FIRM|nr:RHS repeat-associated core domain-containing protein [Roseburia intestinalis]RHC11937.1 hypothetical protein DW856_19620 [Roseburia intestinalis]
MFYWRPPWNISIFLLQISLDRFDGSTGYYLYDARGSVSGITNEEGQVYQSYRYSVTGEITFGAPQYENEYTYNGESYNPNIQSQYLRARYYCVVTATFLTEDSYLGNQTEPLTLNRYNYCVSSYLNYTDPSGNEVEVLESLKGWIIDPDTQAQKTIENYENQRLNIEDAIESGLLNNRAGQIFLDYGDIVMGPAVKTPADIIVIRETVKGNSDSKEMQRTATAGFYAGFVGQGIEYTQIISNADYQLSMIITSAKGVNSINNPLSYLLFIKDFSLTQTIDAAKAGLQDAWNGTYDSAIGRKIGAGTFNYLLMTIGGALLKGKGTACEAVESGSNTGIWDMTEGGGVINGREYSQHAMERMAPDTPTVRAELSKRAEKAAQQKGLEVGTKEYYEYCTKYVDQRNIPPSVIEDAISSSKAIPGNRPDTFIHETLDVKVVINSNGKVITVIPK